MGGGADPQESKDKKLRFDGGEKLPGEGVLGKPQGVHGVQQHELGDQQHGADQPWVHQLGEQQLGEQEQGDFLLEEQQQTNCDAGHENSSEVTVGEVLPAALPGSTEPGGGGGGV